MEINYQICYQEKVVQKHILNLSSQAKILIKRTIEELLTVDLIGFGKPLRYSITGHTRLHVSDYRIVYCIEATTRTFIMVAVKHCKNVYDGN